MTRYSQLYIERGKRQPDSERMRVRLFALVRKVVPDYLRHDVARAIELEQGVRVEAGITGLRTFYTEAETRDILDSVTSIYNLLNETSTRDDAEFWKNWAGDIFDEEHVFYKVDNIGGVQPFVDAEFEINRASALEALDDLRFGEARRDFEAAYRHLRDGNGKEALRMMFPAVEVAAKVLFPGKFAGLAANEVDKHIRPALDRRYAGNQPAIDAGRLLLGGMKSWINASHLYRHGPEQEEPAEPPADFVIAHLSAGASYLRWMIELCSDQETGPA